MNLEALRKTSDAPFPYGWPGMVMYAVVSPDGNIRQLRLRGEFREAVQSADAGEATLIAAWPGEYRTDLFVVDDLGALAAAIGMGEMAVKA